MFISDVKKSSYAIEKYTERLSDSDYVMLCTANNIIARYNTDERIQLAIQNAFIWILLLPVVLIFPSVMIFKLLELTAFTLILMTLFSLLITCIGFLAPNLIFNVIRPYFIELGEDDFEDLFNSSKYFEQCSIAVQQLQKVDDSPRTCRLHDIFIIHKLLIAKAERNTI